MERDRYLRVLADESAALLSAAAAAGPTAPVPGCPGWTASDLVFHVGRAQAFWAYVVGERATTPDGYQPPARPEGSSPEDTFDRLTAFAAGRSAALGEVLAAADPAVLVWTWAGPRPVSWVVRRMAHEAAVHRVDAEHCAGRDVRIDPELAADGVDDFLTDFTALTAADDPVPAGTIHLHCVDTPGEWTVTIAADGAFTVGREHAKGDVALRGPAHDLLMVLWRRSGVDAVETFGDLTLATEFLARIGTG